MYGIWAPRMEKPLSVWLVAKSHTLSTYEMEGAQIPYKSHGGSLHTRNAKNMAGQSATSHTLSTYRVQGAQIPYKSHGGSLHARNAKNVAEDVGLQVPVEVQNPLQALGWNLWVASFGFSLAVDNFGSQLTILAPN